MRSSLMALLFCVSAGCATDDAADQEDPTLYLTGTEELAREQPDGTFDCDSDKKVLVCHIPPGNPDNAHTICVGEAAVDAHQRNHGDPVGSCDDGGDDGTGDDGTGDDGTGDDGTGDDGTGDDGTGDDGNGDDGDDGTPDPDGGVD